MTALLILGAIFIAVLVAGAFFFGVCLGHEIGTAKPPANENAQDQN